MIRRVFAAVSFLLACGSAICQLAAPTAISDFGYTSCSHSSCLFVPDDQHPKAYRQGDLSYTVTESGTFNLSRGQKVILSTRLKDLSASVFVVWLERNEWFAITWSDGGAIGNFHTRVVQIAGDQAVEAESVKTAFSDFRGRHWCKARGDNVQAYGWCQFGNYLRMWPGCRKLNANDRALFASGSSLQATGAARWNHLFY